MGEGERRSERKPQDTAIIEFIDQTAERERGGNQIKIVNTLLANGAFKRPGHAEVCCASPLLQTVMQGCVAPSRLYRVSDLANPVSKAEVSASHQRLR